TSVDSIDRASQQAPTPFEFPNSADESTFAVWLFDAVDLQKQESARLLTKWARSGRRCLAVSPSWGRRSRGPRTFAIHRLFSSPSSKYGFHQATNAAHEPLNSRP